MGADQGPQKVVIVLDRATHTAVKDCAERFGASIRATLVRYAQEGVERDRRILDALAAEDE